MLGLFQTAKLLWVTLRVLESVLRAVEAKRVFSETSPARTFKKIPLATVWKTGRRGRSGHGKVRLEVVSAVQGPELWRWLWCSETC